MQKQEGFSFRITGESDGSAGRVLAASLLFLGLFACVWSGLGLEETGVNPLPLAAAGLVYCAVACGLPKQASVIQVAAAVVLIAYTVFVSRYIISGWNVAANAVFNVLEGRLGYIFPRYEVTATGLPLSMCAGLFLALPALLLGLLSAKVVCGRRLWLWPVAFFSLALFVLGISNLYPPDWCWALMLLGLVALGIQRLIKQNVRVTPAGTTVAQLLLFAALLAICAILTLSWNGNGDGRALKNRRAVKQTVHRLRYEDGETALPEGNFVNLKSFAPGESTALAITMEKPRELYLRGYVGEIYTGIGWAEMEPRQKAEYATLFAWLHERGFYGQTQYAQLCKAIGAGGRNSDFSITVEDACAARRYAPYGLLDAGADPRRIGDADLPAEGLDGEKEYTFSLTGIPVQEYEQIAYRLTEAREAGNSAAVDYLSSENAYREFVYNSYLEIPEAAEEAISEVFAGLELPKEQKIAFRDVQMVVRTYLSSIAIYNEEPQTIPAAEDFVSGFLLNTQEGYAVHYATAAALMFRYLGVPARYVEGWYLPAETASEMKPGETIELDQSFAHAWVEIYRDGVGFVPFEITPPNTAPVGQNNAAQSGGGGADIPPVEEQKEPMTLQQIFLISLLAFTLLLLLLFLFLVARRALKRKKIRKLLEAEEPSVAVSNMLTWALTLLDCLGIRYPGGSLDELLPRIEQTLDQKITRQFEAVLAAQRQALFSQKGVTDVARAAPMEFLGTLESILRHRGTWLERFRLRWIICVI